MSDKRDKKGEQTSFDFLQENRDADKRQPQLKSPKAAKKQNICELPIDVLQISIVQPRKHIDQEDLEQLCKSIKKHGVLQPVIVQRITDGSYLLVAGQRRFLAAQKAGLKKIPVVFTDGNPAVIALIENLQRSNLTAIEEAEAFEFIKMENDYTLDEIGAIIGKSKSTVSEAISLTKLPDVIKDECRTNPAVAKSILVDIARLQTDERMIKAYEGFKLKNLPREEVRKLARHPATRKKSLGVKFVSSFAQRINAIDIEALKMKQRENMKEQLEELHQNIGDLIVKLNT